MTEEEWLACEDPDDMYFVSIDRLKSYERKKDLFCLACAHLIWDFLKEDARRPYVWLEDHLGEREKLQSRGGVRDLFQGPARSLDLAHHRREGGIAGAATHVAYDFWAGWYEYAFPNFCNDYPIFREMLRDDPKQLLVSIIRDIFGNPFRPITLSPSWLTSTVISLANQMYDTRDFSAMPILADALQDASCDNETILTHCRGPGPHVRGCFVIDLLTNRE
jgi:hypothetical protein